MLDFTLEQNMVLQRYYETKFQNHGFIKADAVREYADGPVSYTHLDVYKRQGLPGAKRRVNPT